MLKRVVLLLWLGIQKRHSLEVPGVYARADSGLSCICSYRTRLFNQTFMRTEDKTADPTVGAIPLPQESGIRPQEGDDTSGPKAVPLKRLCPDHKVSEEKAALLGASQPAYNTADRDTARPEDRGAQPATYAGQTIPPVQRPLQQLGGDLVYDIHKDVAPHLQAGFSLERRTRARTAEPQSSPNLRLGGSWRGKLASSTDIRHRHSDRITREKSNDGSLFLERSFVNVVEHFAQCYSFEHDDIPLLEYSATGATTPKTFIILMKSFLGSAIMFLPSAVAQAGLAYAVALMVFMCLWMCDASLLLFVSSVNTGAASFGELAEASVGPALARVVNLSMCLGQFGYCVTYFIMISQTVGQAANWFMNCAGPDLLSGHWPAALCLAQLLVYLPLSSIRPLSRLASTMLIADVLLGVCLAYLYAFSAVHVAREGTAGAVPWYVGPAPLSFIGTAAYVFEGVGLVLPIASSMSEPQDFPFILRLGMGLLLAIFVSFAALGVLAFGPDVQPTILLNLSLAQPESPAATVIELMYGVVIVLSFPLVLFPGVEILDKALGVAGTSGEAGLRWATVVGIALVAIAFSSTFDVFIALIGAFACIPLGFIYPALIHYRVGAETPAQRAKDVVYVVLGVALMVFIAAEAIGTIATREAPQPLKCIPH